MFSEERLQARIETRARRPGKKAYCKNAAKGLASTPGGVCR
jgi:hypothetical protein